jgi:hypothetical protein
MSPAVRAPADPASPLPDLGRGHLPRPPRRGREAMPSFMRWGLRVRIRVYAPVLDRFGTSVPTGHCLTSREVSPAGTSHS